MAAEPAKNSDRSKDRPEEFSRFEELTKKLLRVSKSEVDEKRKGSKPSPSPRST